MARHVIECSRCGETAVYELRQGRPSQHCPTCREKRKKEWQKQADAQRSKEYLREKSRRYRAGLTPEKLAHRKDLETRWREENKDRAYRKRQEYFYGRPADELLSLRALARCAICKSTDPRDKRGFHIDHDHSCCPGSRSCGECVRALLCGPCNTLVGRLEADPEIVKAALEFIAANPRVDWSVHQTKVL